MKPTLIAVIAALGLLVSGCPKASKSPRNFRLPEGDAANGKVAFITLNCINCHTVDGVELTKSDEKGETTLALGG